MSLTWQQIKRWDARKIGEAEKALKSNLDAILSCADELDTMKKTTAWSGKAAQAASDRCKKLIDDMEKIASEVSATRRALFDAETGLDGIRHAIQEAESFAHSKTLIISDNGTVSSHPDNKKYPTRHAAELAAAERQREIDDCAAFIKAALRKAADVDSDVSLLLSKIVSNGLGDGGATSLVAAADYGSKEGKGSVVEPPPGNSTPSENAAWWQSLSKPEQDKVIKDHPEWIGNRNGVSFSARDQANRNLLPRYREQLKKELESINNDWDKKSDDPDELRKHVARRDLVKDKLASLDTVQRLSEKEDRHIIGLDITRDRTEAIVSQGDLDTAEKVGVFTPGFTSTVQGMEGNDGDMERLRSKTVDNLIDSHKFANKADAMKSVASVTWLGYQAPQYSTIATSNSVFHDAAAVDGGRRLADFFRGINSSRSVDPDITALGHSYGSTTTSFALLENTGVDRVGYFGSPGLASDDEKSYKIPVNSSFYEKAKKDLVAETEWFGTAPHHLKWINQLNTGEVRVVVDGSERTLTQVNGHSSYLNQDSTSMDNLSKVVTGDLEKLHKVGDPHQVNKPPHIKVNNHPRVRGGFQ
ncbi:hypothetical protein KEM60_02862 [Austwickia sp. TVS 96-490-7B]|uniref:alpha/beta hydrolase n=1 Tax=Austwickia sp. TVS 96-490-7B TaxID=2830843 RepID=UPI001C55BE65|nr:alpha/beta hydrolase [Austwickia sp. TVS 96-490-7B]MBW3086633.1 hypothetical protein [Austwickia sp. TVS 96-490-7B]